MIKKSKLAWVDPWAGPWADPWAAPMDQKLALGPACIPFSSLAKAWGLRLFPDPFCEIGYWIKSEIAMWEQVAAPFADLNIEVECQPCENTNEKVAQWMFGENPSDRATIQSLGVGLSVVCIGFECGS